MQTLPRYTIWRRKFIEVCTDPQRRYYNGTWFSSEFIWTEWEVLESDVSAERIEFWQDLNAYAVRERGEGAKQEFELREYHETNACIEV